VCETNQPAEESQRRDSCRTAAAARAVAPGQVVQLCQSGHYDSPSSSVKSGSTQPQDDRRGDHQGVKAHRPRLGASHGLVVDCVDVGAGLVTVSVTVLVSVTVCVGPVIAVGGAESVTVLVTVTVLGGDGAKRRSWLLGLTL
jgi:hypothetical protein